jgi:HEAT repeat protein
MGLFRSRVPDIEKLKVKRDVRGLVAALTYEEPADAPAAARVNRPVVAAATRALFELSADLDASAVQPLGHVLGDANALANAAPNPVIGHGEPRVRWCAAALLRKIGEPAVQPLVNALSDYDDGVRREVIGGLRDIGEPALAPITTALHSESWSVRHHAAEALGEVGNPRAIDALAGVLAEDPDGYVRAAAVVALGRIGDPRAVDALTGALDDSYESARMNAAHFLKLITDQRERPAGV